MESEDAVLMERGNAFQSLGAAIEKARSPLELNLDFGMHSKLWLDDRRQTMGL